MSKIILALLAIFLSSCRVVPNAVDTEKSKYGNGEMQVLDGKPYTIFRLNGEFNESKEQIQEWTEKAASGDAESSYRLSVYYGFYVGDVELAKKYSEEAVERGWAQAQYVRGVRYLNDNPPNIEKALDLIKKAAAQGHKYSIEKLAELSGKTE